MHPNFSNKIGFAVCLLLYPIFKKTSIKFRYLWTTFALGRDVGMVTSPIFLAFVFIFFVEHQVLFKLQLIISENILVVTPFVPTVIFCLPCYVVSNITMSYWCYHIPPDCYNIIVPIRIHYCSMGHCHSCHGSCRANYAENSVTEWRKLP